VIAALVVVVGGLAYWLSTRDSSSVTAVESMGEAEDSPAPDPTTIVEPTSTPAPEPTPVPTSTPEPEPTPTAVPPTPEPPDGLYLATDGLGIVDFGALTGDAIEAVTAELGSPSFDSRWRLLTVADPDRDRYLDDAERPTEAFSYPQYRHVCWGDVVMLCLTHARMEPPGRFVGWHQAHRVPYAYGNDLVTDDRLGTTDTGVSVGSPATAVEDAGLQLVEGLGGTILFSGSYVGRVAGEWSADGPQATDQPVQCLAAGEQVVLPDGAVCVRSVPDGLLLNAQARAVIRAALDGTPIPFLATVVPDGPTPESGFSPFDRTQLIADLDQLAGLSEPDINNAPDLRPDADPGLGGRSCAFVGDVTIECAYRVDHAGGEVVVVLRHQGTGFVGVTVS
jgi:hypothetical protein